MRLARKVLRKGGRAYFAVRTDDPCDGAPKRRTSRGYQVCEGEDAWAREIGKVFPGVEVFERGSNYVTLVAGA